MSNQFGFIDIILLAMFAGFIILRLRNILGRKTEVKNNAMLLYLYDDGYVEKRIIIE